MDVKMMIQPTPNPYAKKIVCNLDVKTKGKATFNSEDEAAKIPLAVALLALPGVTQIHFFENIITLTQDGSTPWDDLLGDAENVVRAKLPEHNPEFLAPEEERRKQLSPELLKIEEILDQMIRPALQGDGGDLEVVGLEGKYLTIRYEGACGTCPSSVSGTLAAIQGLLQQEYDPEIEVIPIMEEYPVY
jgi:Fe-S cluster biogenesis protein NfuA